MITTEQINRALGIKESYQASDVLMKILFKKTEREELFKEILELDWHLDHDIFLVYFEEEHANKKKYAQDFTPDSIAQILSKIIEIESNGNCGTIMDVASGTGSLIIRKWFDDRTKANPLNYKPSNYFYHCEELSDRALPFLLFNLMIRGMNATVVHGDALTRDAKQIYLIQNTNDDYQKYSDINVMPHTDSIMKEFDIRKWLEDPIDHIENRECPYYLKEVVDIGQTWDEMVE